MKIKALTTFTDGYMTEKFVFGASRDTDKITDKKYPYYTISYLIDTGSEVILVDTSYPDDITEMPANDELGIYPGKRVKTFTQALNDVGYKTDDVDKIILTHNHLDHNGAVELFPDAELLMSKAEQKNFDNDGNQKVNTLYFGNNKLSNLEGIYEVVPGVFVAKAYGHTLGQLLVLVYDENDKLFYTISGDVSLSNEAFIQNELSVVNEDMDTAKETQNKIRDFVKTNDTVYLSSHDPQSLNNLEQKIIMKL